MKVAQALSVECAPHLRLCPLTLPWRQSWILPEDTQLLVENATLAWTLCKSEAMTFVNQNTLTW